MSLSDVDLSDEDRAVVRQIATDAPYTSSEAEAIVRFIRLPKSKRNPDSVRRFVDHAATTADRVDASTCADLRDELRAATRPKTVVDAHPDIGASAVYRHATGECEHDIPTVSTNSPRVKRDECRDIRRAVQNGKSTDEIKAGFYRSMKVVVKHAFGDCSHTFDTQHDGRRVAERTCHRMRRVYREQVAVGIDGVASTFFVSAGTAHRHISGACDHGDGVPAPSNGSSDRVDERECDKMRIAYAGGRSITDIEAEFDRHGSSVRRHVFGRCRHGGSPHRPSGRVGPARCAAIRAEYRDRGDTTISDLITRLNVSKGSFYYHLTGDCSHTPGVSAVVPDGNQD